MAVLIQSITLVGRFWPSSCRGNRLRLSGIAFHSDDCYTAPVDGYRQIIVTTDFSDCSYAAFEAARRWAELSGAELALLSILEDWSSSPNFLGFIPDSEAIKHHRKELQQSGSRRLQELAAQYFSGLTVRAEVVLSTQSAADEICAYARRSGADLVIAASHGRGAVGELFLGSVTQRLLRACTCPVLVVRQNR